MDMDVFHEHCAFVDQYTHSQSQTAQSHNVDRLSGQPQQNDGISKANGIVMTTIRELPSRRGRPGP